METFQRELASHGQPVSTGGEVVLFRLASLSALNQVSLVLPPALLPGAINQSSTCLHPSATGEVRKQRHPIPGVSGERFADC